uniref:Uncharacterized protein n=1 Tax=Methylophaga nitratireducenticrescens TaxID=754476 RepID=I1XN09_METNJ
MWQVIPALPLSGDNITIKQLSCRPEMCLKDLPKRQNRDDFARFLADAQW